MVRIKNVEMISCDYEEGEGYNCELTLPGGETKEIKGINWLRVAKGNILRRGNVEDYAPELSLDLLDPHYDGEKVKISPEQPLLCEVENVGKVGRKEDIKTLVCALNKREKDLRYSLCRTYLEGLAYILDTIKMDIRQGVLGIENINPFEIYDLMDRVVSAHRRIHAGEEFCPQINTSFLNTIDEYYYTRVPVTGMRWTLKELVDDLAERMIEQGKLKSETFEKYLHNIKEEFQTDWEQLR